MLSCIYRSLWTTSTLDCLTVSLGFVVYPYVDETRRNDRWKNRRFPYGQAIPRPAFSPSPTELIHLATAIRQERPGLDGFSFAAKCSYDTGDDTGDLASWQLDYPATAQGKQALNRKASLEGHHSATILLPATENDTDSFTDAQDAVRLTTSGEHPEFACCMALRDEESDIVERAYEDTEDEEEDDFQPWSEREYRPEDSSDDSP